MLKRPRTANLMSLLLVASVAGPALGLGLLAWVTYHRAFVDARRELAWTCAVALEHAAKVFDSYDLVVDRVQDALLGADPSDIARREGSFHDRFREMIAALPQVQSLVVLDRDGRAQVATQAYPVDRFVDFADRDYFQALKAGGSRTFISRLQTSLLTGKTFFGWGRARHDGQDDFDGVVDIAIDPEFFDRFYATLVRDVGGSVDGRVVTMIRSDGQILLRYPSFQGPPPMVSASNPFFEAVRADPDGGTYRSASVIDSGAPSVSSPTGRFRAIHSTWSQAARWTPSRRSGATTCCATWPSASPGPPCCSSWCSRRSAVPAASNRRWGRSVPRWT